MESIWNEKFVKNFTLEMKGLRRLGIREDIGNSRYGIRFFINQDPKSALTFNYEFTISRNYFIDLYYYSVFSKKGRSLKDLLLDTLDLSFAPAKAHIFFSGLDWQDSEDNLNPIYCSLGTKPSLKVSLEVMCLPHFDLGSMGPIMARVRDKVLKALIYLHSLTRIEVFNNELFREQFLSKKKEFTKNVKDLKLKHRIAKLEIQEHTLSDFILNPTT